MKKTLIMILTMLLAFYFTGCGQTGPLYLPPVTEEPVDDNDQ